MQQSSATPSLHLWFWGVAEDCCMLSLLLAVPSCIYSFWHGVIPTSYFIFNDFYTCSIIHVSPSVYTKLPSCIYSFWHGVIPTSYFIFNDFYTCIPCSGHVHQESHLSKPDFETRNLCCSLNEESMYKGGGGAPVRAYLTIFVYLPELTTDTKWRLYQDATKSWYF